MAIDLTTFKNQRCQPTAPRGPLTKLDDCSFGSVVRRLQLRDVGYMRAHTRSGDETSQPEILQFLPIQVRPLRLLTPPVKASGVCTVIDAVHIGRHDILVMFNLTVKKIALSPWNSSVRNENVKAAIEFFHDLIDCFLDVFLASDIYLICST